MSAVYKNTVPYVITSFLGFLGLAASTGVALTGITVPPLLFAGLGAVTFSTFGKCVYEAKKEEASRKKSWRRAASGGAAIGHLGKEITAARPVTTITLAEDMNAAAELKEDITVPTVPVLKFKKRPADHAPRARAPIQFKKKPRAE